MTPQGGGEKKCIRKACIEYIICYICSNFRAFYGQKGPNIRGRTMNAPIHSIWDGVERRKAGGCRRKSERRSYRERRFDPRSGKNGKRGLSGYLRSLVNSRIGVDRRKQSDQRIVPDRRQTTPRSMLTAEELADLLS